MTSWQQFLVVSIILIGAVVMGFREDDPTLVFALFGTVLGYVFGRTNGEKALAREIISLQAAKLTGPVYEPEE